MIKLSKEKKLKWITFIGIFIVLTLVCIGSSVNNLYRNSKNTVTVSNQDSLPLSPKQHVITQDIRLEGTLQELLLYCSAPSGEAYADARVEITIEQEDACLKQSVAAKAFTSPYTIRDGLKQFNAGMATLRIEGSDFDMLPL